MNDSNNDVLLLLQKYQAQVEESLEKVLPRRATSKSLHALIGPTRFKLHEEALNKAINEPVWNFLDRGGKRWRPALFLMIVDLLGKNPKDFVDFSTIFELIHNGTLMVDDIEDSSSLRRGKPALHLIYGVDVAINTGNTLYYLPLKVLDKYKNKLSKDTLLAVYKTYRDEMITLSLGQGTDIVWHRGLVDDLKISPAQYLQMCAFKTGGLARMASKMAAIVGGVSPKLVDAFGRLGESLGIVFQIQDDILNITENELSAKKGLGEDITEGKRSLPVIYAFSSLPRAKAARLRKILLMHTKDKKLISEAIALICEGQGIEKAQKIMQKLFTDAWSELDPLLPKSDKKDRLYNLAYFLINRQV